MEDISSDLFKWDFDETRIKYDIFLKIKILVSGMLVVLLLKLLIKWCLHLINNIPISNYEYVWIIISSYDQLWMIMNKYE